MRLSLLVTAALAAGCARSDAPPAADGKVETPASAAAPVAAADASPDGWSRSFTSVLSRFEMAVPDRWAQRYSASERTNPVEYAGATSVVEFVFLAPGGEPPPLLAILRYPKGKWRGTGPRGAQVLQEAGADVFVAVLPSGSPFPAGSDDAKTYEAMKVTLDEIQPRFRGR